MFYGKVWAILFVAYLMQYATALKCWKCGSDSVKTKFCGRNMDTNLLTDEQKQDLLVDCNSVRHLKNGEQFHTCEVYKQIINNFEEVYVRGCAVETKNAPPDHCLSSYGDTSFVKTAECKTCLTDGCNDSLDNASIGVKISKVVVVSLIVLTVLLV